MATARQHDLLAQALLREYMHRRGFKATLQVFDAESPRDGATVSSRAAMAGLLCWDDVAPRIALDASAKAAPPFMVQLCQYRLRKRELRRRAAAPAAAAAAGEDSSDDDAATAQEIAAHKARVARLRAEVDALAKDAADADARLREKQEALAKAAAAGAAALGAGADDALPVKKRKTSKTAEGAEATTTKSKKSSASSTGDGKATRRHEDPAPRDGSLSPVSPPIKTIAFGTMASKLFDPLLLSATTAASGSAESAARRGGWAPGPGAAAPGGGATASLPVAADSSDRISYDPLLMNTASARAIALATPVHADKAAAALQQQKHGLNLADTRGGGASQPAGLLAGARLPPTGTAPLASPARHPGAAPWAATATPSAGPNAALSVPTKNPPRNEREEQAVAMLTAAAAPLGAQHGRTVITESHAAAAKPVVSATASSVAVAVPTRMPQATSVTNAASSGASGVRRAGVGATDASPKVTAASTAAPAADSPSAGAKGDTSPNSSPRRRTVGFLSS